LRIKAAARHGNLGTGKGTGVMSAFKENVKALVEMEHKKYASLLENLHTYDNEGRLLEVIQPDCDKLPKFSAYLGVGKQRMDHDPTPQATGRTTRRSRMGAEAGVLHEDH